MSQPELFSVLHVHFGLSFSTTPRTMVLTPGELYSEISRALSHEHWGYMFMKIDANHVTVFGSGIDEAERSARLTR